MSENKSQAAVPTAFDNAGILKEYESLRDEINKRQEARLAILAFTLAVVGTILGISFQGTSTFASNGYLPTVLGIFALIVVISALSLTTQYTQSNRIKAQYIKQYIEEAYPAWHMNYERRWEIFNKRRTGVWRTSRALALTYLMLTTAVLLVVIYPAWSLDGVYQLPACIITVLFAVIAYLLCYDLFTQRTKAWKETWGNIK